MKNHIEFAKNNIIKSVDSLIEAYHIRMDPEKRKQESLVIWNGLMDESPIIGIYTNLVFAYYTEGHEHYRDDKLLEYSYKCLEFYADWLHEDGSSDLIVTNFHDPSQTGFDCLALDPPLLVMQKLSEHTPLEDKLYEKGLELVRRTGEAMVNLGFHTPNHRWVISSALAMHYHLTGEQKYLDHINRFMIEGIDCDECGEWTERSTGSYNYICDRAFILLGLFLDPSYFEYARRNLRLMLHYLEPDWTVNTLNSTRWDNGGQYDIAKYFMPYAILAYLDGDAEFAYMADQISERYNSYYADSIMHLFALLHPEFAERSASIETKEIAKDRTIFLPGSRMARIFRPELDMTMTLLCSRHPVFFQMNYGTSLLQVRFAGSFFGDPHSQFRAREIIPTEDGYKLIAHERAGYRSQLPEKPETPYWRMMDHSKRDTINVQELRTEITVHILEDGATFDIETFGCERVPTKLEFVMEAGKKLNTDTVCLTTQPGDYLFLKAGTANYHIDGRRYFEIGEGFFKHSFGANMRGAFPQDAGKFTLAMTSDTPQKSTVTVRAKKIY